VGAFDVFEEVDVGRTHRTRRLVLSRRIGGDFTLSFASFFACVSFGMLAAWPASLELSTRMVPGSVAVLLACVALGLARAGYRNRELIVVPVPGDDLARSKVRAVTESLDWDANRDNRKYARYFTDRCVVLAIFLKDEILLNCRRQTSPHARVTVRMPLDVRERTETLDPLVRALTDAA